MAKFDIASAYRIKPVNPEDRLLLCLRWRGELLPCHSASYWCRNYSQQLQTLDHGEAQRHPRDALL